MRIAICDDEQTTVESNVKLITKVLNDVNADYIIDTYISPLDMIAKNEVYDMLFLDIEMQELSGLHLAERILQSNENCFVFFITNYPIYLDDALNMNTFRFFSKPLDERRLRNGILTAISRMKDREAVITLSDLTTKQQRTIEVSSIILIENIGRNTKVYTKSGQFVSGILFSKLQSMLSEKSKEFVLSHQSYMINIRYVKTFTKNSVILSYAGEDFAAYMSRRRYKEFEKKLMERAAGII